MTLHTLRLIADPPFRPEGFRRPPPAGPRRRIGLGARISAFLRLRGAIGAHFHRI